MAVIRTCLLVPLKRGKQYYSIREGIQKESEHGTQVANVAPEPKERYQEPAQDHIAAHVQVQSSHNEWCTCQPRGHACFTASTASPKPV